MQSTSLRQLRNEVAALSAGRAPALLVLFRGRYLLDLLRGLLGIAKSKADAIAEQGRK